MKRAELGRDSRGYLGVVPGSAKIPPSVIPIPVLVHIAIDAKPRHGTVDTGFGVLD